MVFLRDNQSAFISNWVGDIKIIKWKAGANSGDEFDYAEEPKKVGKDHSQSICLTKDEKYLLVGSKSLVRVFEIITGKIIKQFELTTYLRGINLIKNGKKAIIAERNGN